MAESPQVDTDGVLRVAVYCDGEEQVDLPLIGITVRLAFNRIPWAELLIKDGDMPTGEFELSDRPLFAPGAKVRIAAGFGDALDDVFSGMVIRHGVKIEGQNQARLVVECRDPACKMTLGRRNANFLDQKDSDILSSLVSAHGLSADVADTGATLAELVQYYCSDWDFLLARAEFNGLLVNVTPDKLQIQPPKVDGAAALELAWGRDLFEFSADIDARLQYTEARATAWDAKQQAIVQGNAAKPAALNQQGNLSGSVLAEVSSPDTLQLQTATQQEAATLSTWAKSTQLKAELARIRGHLRCMGNAAAKPGALITVKGVGQRFEGDVFVSAVEHTLVGGYWYADVEFGLAPHWHTERDDVSAPLAAGLLPGVGGLQIGVVLKLDGDPQEAQRIQIKLPVMQASSEGIWARLLSPYASNGFGAFFPPEVGDEVIVGYLNDDPCHPVVLGAVYSAKHQPPYALDAPNDTKAIVTRAQHRIEFNEKDKIVTITTPAQNRVVLDDKDKSILIEDQHANSVKLSSAGIALDSPYDISLSAKGNIKLQASQGISLSAQMDVKASGLNINCEAQVGFVGKGSATAELSAAGQTTVKGGLVMIN
jgi:Rhs element Vgr protein